LCETVLLKNKKTKKLEPVYKEGKLEYQKIAYDHILINVQKKTDLIKAKSKCNRSQDQEDIRQIKKNKNTFVK